MDLWALFFLHHSINSYKTIYKAELFSSSINFHHDSCTNNKTKYRMTIHPDQGRHIQHKKWVKNPKEKQNLQSMSW